MATGKVTIAISPDLHEAYFNDHAKCSTSDACRVSFSVCVASPTRSEPTSLSDSALSSSELLHSSIEETIDSAVAMPGGMIGFDIESIETSRGVPISLALGSGKMSQMSNS